MKLDITVLVKREAHVLFTSIHSRDGVFVNSHLLDITLLINKILLLVQLVLMLSLAREIQLKEMQLARLVPLAIFVLMLQSHRKLVYLDNINQVQAKHLVYLVQLELIPSSEKLNVTYLLQVINLLARAVFQECALHSHTAHLLSPLLLALLHHNIITYQLVQQIKKQPQPVLGDFTAMQVKFKNPGQINYMVLQEVGTLILWRLVLVHLQTHTWPNVRMDSFVLTVRC